MRGSSEVSPCHFPGHFVYCFLMFFVVKKHTLYITIFIFNLNKCDTSLKLGDPLFNYITIFRLVSRLNLVGLSWSPFKSTYLSHKQKANNSWLIGHLRTWDCRTARPAVRRTPLIIAGSLCPLRQPPPPPSLQTLSSSGICFPQTPTTFSSKMDFQAFVLMFVKSIGSTYTSLNARMSQKRRE